MDKWGYYHIYRKNKDDIKSLLLFRYPQFIYRSTDRLPIGDIPVFTFHSVKGSTFEYYLKYLVDNNYNTISTSEFYDILSGDIEPIQNSILLTFDDGLRSLWSVGFPLLKKYGLKATCFIVPSFIKENECIHPNIENVWSQSSSIEEIEKIESKSTFCNWDEIKIMERSGIIDFQSHTLGHNTVCTSNKLVDFLNPKFGANFIHYNFNPLMKSPYDKMALGTPIYKWGANMAEHRRFIEDEVLCKECVKYVKSRNGVRYFDEPDWRKRLFNHYQKLEKLYGNKGYYQSLEKRKEDLLEDLSISKRVIEQKLNKEVVHLCYPWGLGSKLSVEMSKECGFKCNYWGHLKKVNINRRGDDPFYITRILYENYLLSLPGKKRIPISKQIKNKFYKFIFQKVYKCRSNQVSY